MKNHGSEEKDKHRTSQKSNDIMGLNLKDLVVREKTSLEAFSTKVIAIDAYNEFINSLPASEGQTDYN